MADRKQGSKSSNKGSRETRSSRTGAGPEGPYEETTRDFRQSASDRPGALEGVGDISHAGSADLTGDEGGHLRIPEGGGQRRNPPLTPDAGIGDGGLSASGGAAGGARGNSGSSDRANPANESAGGPGEYRSSSRADLDHPSNS